MHTIPWRDWVRRFVGFWRTSLQFRTVAATVVLSALAVGVIGAYMSVSIGDYLFSSRRDQIAGEAAGAQSVAQRLIDSAQATGDGDPDLRDLGIIDAIRSSTTSPGNTSIAIRRIVGQAGSLQPNQTQGFPEATLTADMRSRVADESAAVLLQSVALGGTVPGLVAGAQLTGPGTDVYALYLVYDLSDLQGVLGFVQQALFVGGAALVLLIGAVTYIVVRLVVGPVRLAATTSERIAAGELEVRIPERGQDVIATLARSFNRMADSLQEQITKLAELSRLQQRFVSDVSHELRTPLTTIRLAGDVIYDQRESFPPATERTAELLHTQVQRFELLLGDLLEISRYDAGAVELDLEPTNLVRLVDDAVESMEALAAERGTRLRVVAPGGYFEAEVDARRIRRILRNLLGNAVEHGEGGPVVVMVDSNETAIAIVVRDHGVGMTEADAAKVFERFWRADPSRTRTIGGTGLGLAIALEDAALHDGRLDVWSAPGDGTAFRLTLPRVRGAAVLSSPIPLPPEDEPTSADTAEIEPVSTRPAAVRSSDAEIAEDARA